MKFALSKKQLTDLFLFLIISAVWFSIGWIARGGPNTEIALVEQTRRHLLTRSYNAKVSPRDLSYAAIRGMLKASQDPYAALLEPPIAQRYQTDFAGQSGIIGLVAEKAGDQIVATTVFPGQPAAQAGIQEGDVILAIDGFAFDRDTTDTEATYLVRGPVGAPAHLIIQRGFEKLTFDPIRQERTIVTGTLLDDNIAYLAQFTFTTNSPDKFKATLQELLTHKPQGIIWDLRSNGGGSMDAAQTILNYFIKDGLLFSAQIKNGDIRAYSARPENFLTDLPLVVLIGPHSYSAAETSAIAVIERHRGTLIGNTTHGKGTIQDTVPLGPDCMLHYTVARWLSPEGNWIEGKGVPATRIVQDDPSTPQDEEIQAAITYLKSLTP